MKKIPLSDAAHPARQAAISIIENVIEPLIKKGLNGEKYYATEDAITSIIGKIKEARNADIKPEFLVIGSNNFWYSSGEESVADCKKLIKSIKKDYRDGCVSYADPETGAQPDKPERFYIYEARERK